MNQGATATATATVSFVVPDKTVHMSSIRLYVSGLGTDQDAEKNL